MKAKYFTVHDSKAGGFLPPFLQHNEAMAIRMFTNMLKNPDHQFSQNPADYTLFTIGEFDDATGELKPRTPMSLGNGLEFKTTAPSEEDLQLERAALLQEVNNA